MAGFQNPHAPGWPAGHPEKTQVLTAFTHLSQREAHETTGKHYIYIYIYMYICVCIHMYNVYTCIYIYILYYIHNKING